ncbi:phosphoribulokinase/uridine kinase [Chytridium lagenaria]|nr:phosphoribulokinase/uridine kinase [Chytridium lagenaria]
MPDNTTVRKLIDERILPHFTDGSPRHRLTIAIAGIPGSGKTTLASLLKSQIPLPTIIVPMDGFHLTRAQLDQLPDPSEAHRRRGAPFTFNPDALLSLTHRIHTQTASDPPIYAPSFDHSLKDPIENDIEILSTHRIIIFEGLYLHLASPDPWPKLEFDERWFVPCSKQIAEQRLVKRHVETGVAPNAKAALDRIRNSDMINADLILTNRLPSDVEVTL